MTEAFDQAARDAQALPARPDNTTLLQLYALYKQATEGDVKGERPGGFDFIGAAKFDAWAALRGSSQDDAERQYIALVERLKG
ncbi:acyl-CoA-binding protein [Deinococcus peraridilitoris]|uniref:Acyl-CoA-binding protein n=1 Tax=Deinococcus peraridilitoris (strain DSM 19664 / LMG 22246 / CIP 109416 / KR-200) TaxID=937777 RepID=L0A392_DEIPD|nr:acyl-CoA-binding protein [Deinococcus peraridilitoris]AFZ68368.1 acyl-CoA-binding protein [Deinococcus peraridilitoris DSM 19664]